ncbi:MAG: ketoacyl-ACP synthase III, partial [Bacteroidota bacterium]
MSRAYIKDLAVYLPEQVVDNEEVEARINRVSALMPAGVLQKLFGIQERRQAKEDEQVSDLAAKAACELLQRHPEEEIDFLIFASACSDLIEPATANIVQHKLDLHCPAMDMKNACNSFVSAMMAADAMIQAGFYRRILVVSGEKPSDSINYQVRDLDHLKRALAAFTLGDAGAAAILEASPNESGIVYQKFLTAGQHWPLCTIPGGGSMYPHDASKNY